MKVPRLLAGLGLLALCTPLLAQDHTVPEPGHVDGLAVYLGLETWRGEHGSSWRVEVEPTTGRAEFLYGGSAEPAFAPWSDGDWFSVARLFVEATEQLFGIESTTLVEDRVRMLPLGLVGSSDKMTVRFRQELRGVPVLGGFVNVLTDLDGNLLSVQSTALPQIGYLGTSPVLDARRATDVAVAAFMARVRQEPTQVTEARLGIAGILVEDFNTPHLVWEIDVQWYREGFTPEGTTYLVDALTGAVVREETSVHHFDVGGTVTSMATPGVLPDIGSNPPVQQEMPYIRVQSSAGTVNADADGNFLIPGATGPLNCTFTYVGPFAVVQNSGGSPYSLVQSLSGTSNNVLMNPTSSALVTAQANAYRELVRLRDWTRAVNPADGTADFAATANCNINSNCNAFFNGSSVNFYTAGGGCVNTSYSTVVAHEMGHWLNVLYGTGNGSDGMGEGNADVFAMYLYDNPIVGENFTTTGGFIRTGNNMRQFCGDNNPGCHGGVHANGEVWMGAAWKVRANLKSTHGTQAGGAIADALFNGWMNAYNQTQIKSIIEIQWLTLDDDDGNIENGTPNYSDIDTAFRTQGFPGFDLAFISISDVTQLGNTLNEAGPYTVEATVVPNFAPSINSATLHYRAGAGAFQTVAMSPLGGDSWSGSIPGQASPSKVEYYVSATDSDGNSASFPAAAPTQTLSFFVGQVDVIYSNDFEGQTDEGWTHNTFGDTSNPHDDFQRGWVFGKAGDPSVPASGVRVWGNDLGAPGWNGAYQHNQHNWLRSPQIPISPNGLTILRYNRWLTVQRGQFDQAILKVNGTSVWNNNLSTDHVDTAWTVHELDISSIASGSSSLQIEFSLKSNGSIAFGGWTLDDVEVITVSPSSGCIPPSSYGTGKTNSMGLQATLSSLGTPSATTNDLRITMDLAIPSSATVLFSGSAPDSTPLFGGLRLVAPPLTREAQGVTDGLGASSFDVDVTPAMVGETRYYQQWYRDPADPFTVGLSDGLQVTFCD